MSHSFWHRLDLCLGSRYMQFDVYSASLELMQRGFHEKNADYKCPTQVRFLFESHSISLTCHCMVCLTSTCQWHQYQYYYCIHIHEFQTGSYCNPNHAFQPRTSVHDIMYIKSSNVIIWQVAHIPKCLQLSISGRKNAKNNRLTQVQAKAVSIT